MLAVLAADWSLLLLRAVLAVLFGGMALLWPGLTAIPLVILFGLYSAADGIVGLIVASGAKGLPGFGSLLSEGLVRLGIGLVALMVPALMLLHLPALFATWAALSGIAEIAAAVVLRRELVGEWPLPIAGALSLIVAVFLASNPSAGARAIVWLVGPYAILFAFALMVLTYRLWQLAREMAKA
jgi:uncharacterized membrane protein HdeD (DUF308 family)